MLQRVQWQAATSARVIRKYLYIDVDEKKKKEKTQKTDMNSEEMSKRRVIAWQERPKQRNCERNTVCRERC